MRTFDVDSFVGHKFGKLTVVKYVCNKPIGNHGKTLAMYLCECDCGNQIVVPLQYLKNGSVKMCKDCKKKSYKNKWVGHKFGNLTVIDIVQKAYYDDDKKFHNGIALCMDEHGNKMEVYMSNLKKDKKKNKKKSK